MTGASGALFTAAMLLRLLAADKRVAHVQFVVSDHALRVAAEEMGIKGRTGLLEALLGPETDTSKIHLLNNDDVGAGIARRILRERRHGGPAVLHGHTRIHRQRHGAAAD